MEEDDNTFKTTCQFCNGFVTCSGRSEELLYITFLRYGISTLGLYPEELVPENYDLWWPVRSKIQHIYQSLLKEVNCDHKY